MPDFQRVFEDKHIRTSPTSRMQETLVYQSDYVEPGHPNDVRGQAIYNSQPTTPTFNRDVHSPHRQKSSSPIR